MARDHVPGRSDVVLAAASFGEDFFANQQSEFDADAGETDALTPNFVTGGDVMKMRQFSPLHTRAVVDRYHGARRLVAGKRNYRRAGVQRVGHDLRQNGLFERTRIGVSQVFQKMQQIDARFTHGTEMTARNARRTVSHEVTSNALRKTRWCAPRRAWRIRRRSSGQFG